MDESVQPGVDGRGRRRRRRRRSRRRGRGCFGCLVRSAVLGGAVGGLGLAVAGAAIAILYQRHVVADPGPHLERDAIEAIIVQESPVYYRDGTTRIGVFFEDEHRQYVPWERIPTAYAVAIVAAEDDGFWSHPGVSPRHILRAMLENVRAGTVVAGGSTLTQQTAKNLYYRPDRSFRSKWTELVNALRLEAHYEKEEILTFYANQFHVSGNGRGLGIAARYFFDAEVEDLGVLEAAFLAGLVKAPSHYDPFYGDAERRERSRERAHERTRYVLGRIVAEDAERLAGPLPVRGDPASEAAYLARLSETRRIQAEAERLLSEGFELPFSRGTFRYDRSAVLDEVARRLAEPPFDEVLAKAGVDDPATAGLKVITTLDADVQREAIYALWHHLTEVGTWMEGHEQPAFVRTDGVTPRWAPEHRPRRHEFRLATLTEQADEGGRHWLADLGGNPCRLDRQAMVRAAVAVRRGQAGRRTARASTAFVDAFVAAFSPGDVVWVSVREVAEDGDAVCDLELRPELQGAAVVLEDGRVRAMVGGNDNRNFNRATALRQLGSTWKPLVYHAALQLGWRPTDALDNTRNVFAFSTTSYAPRPDHTPAPVVSMAWAGVNSENLASIWLLYHLTDRLDADGVARLAETFGLARRPGEAERDYAARIQAAGVLPTRRRVVESLYLQARHEVLQGLQDTPHPEDALALLSMPYGWGYEAEGELAAAGGPEGRAWRRRALDNAWVAFSPWIERCGRQYELLADRWDRGSLPPRASIPDLSVWVDGEVTRVACGAIPTGYVSPHDAWDAIGTGASGGRVVRGAPGKVRPMRRPMRREAAPPRPPLVDKDDLRLDDRMHWSTAVAVQGALRRRQLARRAAGASAPGLYDPEILYWNQDFRVLLSLRYVADLARRYGVRTEIQEVLSLPLGASEITLEEATAVYGGLVTGEAWRFPGQAAEAGGGWAEVGEPLAATLLIAEIQDVDGRVIYRARPEAERVAAPEHGAMTADILRSVVRHGTGRRAATLLTVGGGVVPLGGKTGTTNDFRNAAFLGFVPGATRGGYGVDAGYTVGVYVGYDDNRSMRSGGIRLAGASGALPAWMGIATGLETAGLLGTPPSGTPKDGWWPLVVPDGDLVRVPVDPDNGLPVDGPPAPVDDVSGPSILAPPLAVPTPPEVEPVATKRPWRVRMAPRTTEADRWRGRTGGPGGLWERR